MSYMKHFLRGLVTAAVIFNALNIEAVESFCDRGLKPLAGELGYGLRNGICEGLYESPTSALLDIVSLTAGPISYQLHKDVVLEIPYPVNDVVQGDPVHVRAMALPIRTYYQMDALLRRGTSVKWPVADVLLLIHLDSAKLGVLGWIDTEAGNLYVPLMVRTTGVQASTDTDKRPRLTIRSPLPLEAVVWRWYADNLNESSSLKWIKAIDKEQRPGAPITMVLPANAPRVVRIDVHAVALNRDKPLTLSVRVLSKAYDEESH